MRKRITKVPRWVWPGVIIISPVILVIAIIWSPVYYLYQAAKAIDILLGDDETP